MKQSFVVDPSRARERRIGRIQRRSIAIAAIFDALDAAELRGVQPRLPDLLQRAAAAWRLPVRQVLAQGRSMATVRARHEYYYAAMTETTRSTEVIGKICGNREHSTVIHGAASHAHRNNLPAPRGLDCSGWKKFSSRKKQGAA